MIRFATMNSQLRRICVATTMFASALFGQPRGGPQPEFVRQAQQMIREGKPEEALAIYRKELAAAPDSPAANNGAGTVLDLMGRGAEARRHFQKAIDAAPDGARKAAAERAMAMSFAFEGDCANAARYEQMVFDYQVSVKDSYQQGEIADEAARVCIDAGDLDAAAKWYKIGHDAGLQEPGIAPGRKDLWEFRWEHAQARIAARRGDRAEARKHVAAARAVLDDMKAKDAGMAQQQEGFFAYLAGYVAYYAGEYQAALEELQKANPNDPFFQCLIGMTYEKLGDKEKAMEAYRQAAGTTGHNPPAAFARPFARKKLAGA